VFGDDRLGLGRCNGFAGGVADDVGHAAVHDRPAPFGQPAGDDAQGLDVLGAPFHHLLVVDLGELRVLLAGVVGGADQRDAQQPGTGLGDGVVDAVAAQSNCTWCLPCLTQLVLD